MANKKIDQLSEVTTLAADDLLITYDISEPGTEKTKKITADNALGTRANLTVSERLVIPTDEPSTLVDGAIWLT